jgi:hypothetical protein
MPKSSKITESAFEKAYEAYFTREKPKIRALAREFGLTSQADYKRLLARIKGRAPLSAKKPINKALNESQEYALEQWIRQRDDIGRPATKGLIKSAAQSILTRNTPTDEDPPVLSKMWIYRYVKRLPADLYLIKQKTIGRKRFEAKYEREQFVTWFNQLEAYAGDILPRNIYNFDETGFQLGQGKAEDVVTAYPDRFQSNELAQSDSRETCTLIECIAANGEAIAPYIIFKGSVHLERWYRLDSLPGDDRIAVSPKGYTNDQLGLDWLNHFIQCTRDRTKRGEKRLLLFDGHGSHLTFEFLSLCSQNDIIPFCFIAHSTHFTQPLDGNPFLAYKHYFRTRNSELAAWAGLTSDKVDFLREIASIRYKTFTQRTIRHSFESRGLYPFDPSKILDQFPEGPILEIWDGNTPPPASSITNSPPGSIRKIRRTSGKLRDQLKSFEEQLEEDSGLYNAFQAIQQRYSLLEESLFRVGEALPILQSDIQRFEQLSTPTNQKKSKRQVPTNGPLSVEQGIRHVELRDEEELYKSIKTVRKISLPTPVERSEKQKQLDEEIDRALADISHIAYRDNGLF